MCEMHAWRSVVSLRDGVGGKRRSRSLIVACNTVCFDQHWFPSYTEQRIHMPHEDAHTHLDREHTPRGQSLIVARTELVHSSRQAERWAIRDNVNRATDESGRSYVKEEN